MTRAAGAAPARTIADILPGGVPPTGSRPQVLLPGGPVSITETAEKLGPLLAASKAFYIRGGALVRVVTKDGAAILQPVPTAALPSIFEQFADLAKVDAHGEVKSTISNKAGAELIVNAEPFQNALPPIRVLSNCPVLTERPGGELIVVSGYDFASGILVMGPAAVEVPSDEAVAMLQSALDDFQFATPSDRSRALAAIITPALVFGGLLGGRAPVDLGEADASQTGKGYRNRVNAEIYRAASAIITQQRGGVGGLEEKLSAKLMEGKAFISLDNIRGSIDVPAFESLLTEDSYVARIPYCQPMTIDPRRTIFQITSNKADITPDLANRSSCVRILKQPDGYQFRTFPEGDLLDHVRANQPRFLGAVFAVVRAWHAAGKPRTAETRHDFRSWARILDWIIQHIFDAPPLLDGHRETQIRMATPALNWLRDVALAVRRAGQFGAWLMAGEILDIIARDPAVEMPWGGTGDELVEESKRKAALQAMGRRLGMCFKSGDMVTLDGIEISRQVSTDEVHSREIRHYIFADAGSTVPNTNG